MGSIQNPVIQDAVLEIFIVYMIFSFITNLIREIIKDIDDLKGDHAVGLKTLPLRFGIDVAIKVAISLTILTIIILIIWMSLTSIEIGFRAKSFIFLFVIAPLGIVIQILTKTTHKRNFSKLSIILKWILLAGLISLILISPKVL